MCFGKGVSKRKDGGEKFEVAKGWAGMVLKKIWGNSSRLHEGLVLNKLQISNRRTNYSQMAGFGCFHPTYHQIANFVIYY